MARETRKRPAPQRPAVRAVPDARDDYEADPGPTLADLAILRGEAVAASPPVLDTVPVAPAAKGRDPFPTSIPWGVEIARRIEWFDLALEYPDAKFKMWVNHPPALRARFFGPQTSKDRHDALKTILLEHNGWRGVDEDGNPFEYPPMGTDEFYVAIPTDMLMVLVDRMLDEAASLPNSLRRTSAISSSVPSSPSAAPA